MISNIVRILQGYYIRERFDISLGSNLNAGFIESE